MTAKPALPQARDFSQLRAQRGRAATKNSTTKGTKKFFFVLFVPLVFKKFWGRIILPKFFPMISLRQ